MGLLMLMLMSALAMNQAQAQHVFNIKDFGAVGDGRTDTSKALSDAWSGACHSKGTSVVLIPRRTYLLGPVLLAGPCNGAIEFQIKGGLRAFSSPQLGIDHWISFQYIDKLTITGGGLLDGQGAASWPYNDCSKNPNCKALPVTMRFSFVTKAWIHNVISLNSKNFHFNLFSCKDMTFEHVTIIAPKDSPNTDGIHMALSSYIFIRDSGIGTGDDCISLGPGSENINMTGITCGPGHGVSVGSLGAMANEPRVNSVFLGSSTFTDTMNGVRIKTKATSYPGAVSDITFQNIIVNKVNNPIIIDQQYCPSKQCRLQISDVRFRNIRGTSSSLVAVNINCSPAVPCTGIELRDIDLEYGGRERKASSVCANAKGASYGKQNPPSCLKSSLHNIRLI
ncbi:exopolygalacturonase-like [Syzygium oleosum]|uniref:exopolygalacturonase-like n=1 Tax=Syzygium oleosum TaxID=219896 RepID=UPI0024B9ED30|nr:exopolygalacturonase-like [Syzygium oleosum]